MISTQQQHRIKEANKATQELLEQEYNRCKAYNRSKPKDGSRCKKEAIWGGYCHTHLWMEKV